MILRIFKDEIAVRIPRKKLMDLFETVMLAEFHKQPPGTINLVFCDDREIQRLNREYRKKNKPTDVLSFNIEEPTREQAVFGEIYISVETAERQAADYEAPLSEEILRLTCHGLLHLLGYDHIKPEDEKIMKTAENEYINRLETR